MAYSDDLVSDVLGIHARATEELVYNGTLLALGPVCSYEFTGIRPYAAARVIQKLALQYTSYPGCPRASHKP